MKISLLIARSLFLISLVAFSSNADHQKGKERRRNSILRKAPGEYRVCRPKIWQKGRSRRLIPTVITPYDTQVVISDGTGPAQVVLRKKGKRGGELRFSRNLPDWAPGERSIMKRDGVVTQERSTLSSQTVMWPNYGNTKKQKHVVERVLNVEKLEIECEVVDFQTAVKQKDMFEAQKFLNGVYDEESRLRKAALEEPVAGFESFYNDFFEDYYQNIFAAYKDENKRKSELEKLKKLVHDAFWAVKEGGQMKLDPEAFNAYYSLDPNWIKGFQIIHTQEKEIELAKARQKSLTSSEILVNLEKAEKILARVSMGANQRNAIEGRIKAAKKATKKLAK